MSRIIVINHYYRSFNITIWLFLSLYLRINHKPLHVSYSGRQRADAELAYELQAAKEKQKIRNEEIEIEIVERKKQISIEEQEILRKEKELTSTVRLPAEAESYRVETLAQGKR